jgi:hypothetical protein
MINGIAVASILSRLWALIEFDMLPMFFPLFANPLTRLPPRPQHAPDGGQES